MPSFYTTKQVGDLTGVHITTVIRWFDSGELTGWSTPGGRRRISAESVAAFVERHKIPVKVPVEAGEPAKKEAPREKAPARRSAAAKPARKKGR